MTQNNISNGLKQLKLSKAYLKRLKMSRNKTQNNPKQAKLI